MESTYFRRGFGLKAEIAGPLSSDYSSDVVEGLRARGNRPERTLSVERPDKHRERCGARIARTGSIK